MTPYTPSLLLAIMIFQGSSIVEGAAEIEMAITPLRDTYHRGEPVGIVLSMTNVGRNTLQLDLWYPHRIGITFACKDCHVEPSRDTIGGVRPLVDIAPGEELVRVFAVNRFVRFPKLGRYVVEYSGLYVVWPSTDDGPAGMVLFRPKGELVIELKAGPIDEQWIHELVNVLAQKKPQPWNDETDDQHTLSWEEALELLLWTDTPLVIEPLISAGKQARMGAARRVIASLHKFFPQHERARAGILEIARADDGDPFVVRAALDVYEKEDVVVPAQWFRPILTSDYVESIAVSLEYLRRHATSEAVSLVEPLLKSENEATARRAASVVKELRARPPSGKPDGT